MKRPSDSLHTPRQYSDYEYSSASEWDSDMEMDKSQSRRYNDEDARHIMPAANGQMSSSYYVSVAERTIKTLKTVVKDDGYWKKALKHKSGVIVYIRQSLDSTDKAPIFKGEGIIKGYSPQAIFHVIGMRKLWDENFVEGTLLENLNDTTSITYEVVKPPSASKPSDLCLVEKIECTNDGVIYFACASVDTPKKPKVNGRNRSTVKLQGWILKPLHTSPASTRITYVIQEGSRGWMQGFTKKTMARKPLVIASIDKYLQEKAERLYSQNQISRSASTGTPSSNHGRRPSLMDNRAASQPLPIRTTSLGLPSVSAPTLNLPRHTPSTFSSSNASSDSINTTSTTPTTSNISTPHTSVSSSNSINRRRIRFADHDEVLDEGSQPILKNQSRKPLNDTIPSILVTNQHNNLTQTNSKVRPTQSQNLYPSHRHIDAKQKSVSKLKLLASTSLSEWTKMAEGSEGIYLKRIEGLAMPIMRCEKRVSSGWTVEQLCTVVQNFGARKIWDPKFVDGKTVERFSQKDYLIYTKVDVESANQMRDFVLLSSIDSEPASGTVYYVLASVEDRLIPKSDVHVRGHVFLEGWVFAPTFDTAGRTRSVLVTYISHVDLRQPIFQHSHESLERLLYHDTVRISSIEKFLNRYGCPPYVRRVAGKVSKETFDAQKKMYAIAFIVKHTSSIPEDENAGTWCTDIRIHASLYPSGMRIHASPQKGIRVDLRQDCAGIRVYSTSPDMDGAVLTVNIMPQEKDLSDSVLTITCNGVPLQPGGSYPVERIISSLSVASDNSSISSESQYQDAVTGHTASNEHTSPLVTPPPTPPEETTAFPNTPAPERPHRRQDSPPPSYNNTIDGNQASSSDEEERREQTRESGRRPTTDTPSSPIPESKAVYEDPFAHFSTQNAIDFDGRSEATERDRRGSLASILTSSDKVLIINDELYFNRQQLALVVLAMVICYYMGKFSCKC